MAEIGLHMHSPFGTQLKPGRFGSRFHGPSPVTLKECPDVALRVISAASGKGGEIAAAVLSAVGLVLPKGPKRVSKDGLALIGTAPGQ